MNLKLMQEDVFERVDRLIDKHGPRLAGTNASLDCAEDLFQELNTFADHAKKEDFNVFQGAFLGWIRILVFSYTLGLVFLWLGLPLITLIVAIISILILTLQFFLYLPLLDRFYPKKKGRNVYGILEPTKEVKQQVIISGHHDSAHVFNFFIHQPKLYNLRTTGSIFFVILMIILSASSLLFKDVIWLYWTINVVLSFGFILVGQMWFFSSKKVAPGAGDNLVASSVAITLGKHFRKLRDQGNGLEHTRIIIMSFDAEEEGLRGARAFAKKHQEHFKKTKTYLLNMDCLYDEKELFFLTSDLNDFVKLDSSLADELVGIAQQLDIKTKTQKQAFLTGGTDAAELAKKGVHATTLIGMPWTNKERSLVYHTPQDTIDHVNPKVVEDTLAIYARWILEKDLI
ncbi:MAG: hypothetical protein A2Y45_01620 [Tenericutes bacterium GWC2_34_14]|nr:MAG: hypothetical protein A2Z84_01835 [Tenericutes bacterium GWA2_35_7]OHE28233.1 MAG: hypothetical protein A2Y45_01620 [Tenericutes bacterium GWC2_34_14]OHE33141.1 MAG: hypothetical protein A2012_00460 [Tenericutes bacterium GWE2_34_108]OHE36261.1 MAG: hypothetical protein A2Y46_07450 [Tenericutes bacterium GWF1_35_14]OHE38697.1 MAG: hypothetical protein A2Y44_04780 [Tenericutes bacterium GWF2_35_184]OHE44803.1 MAG: hypothetical protein A2221_01115 [Tenericutes bacterium RIFOXYA2_FULL_36_3